MLKSPDSLTINNLKSDRLNIDGLNVDKLENIQEKIFNEIMGVLQDPFNSRIATERSRSIQAILTPPSQEFFQIYTTHSKTALVDALRITYSVCHQLVGPDFFKLLALGYLKNNQPVRANLEYYGETFSDFLKKSEICQKNKLYYLSDIARLEWIWKTCLQSVSIQKITPLMWQEAMDQPLDQICFELNQNSRLMISEYPIDDIFLDNIQNQSEHVKTRDLSLSDIPGICLLIWGTSEQVFLKRLNNLELILLSLLKNKLSISRIMCIMILIFKDFKNRVNHKVLSNLDNLDNLENNLFKTIAQWIKMGVIVNFKI
jgi:hypothetical protein